MSRRLNSNAGFWGMSRIRAGVWLAVATMVSGVLADWARWRSLPMGHLPPSVSIGMVGFFLAALLAIWGHLTEEQGFWPAWGLICILVLTWLGLIGALTTFYFIAMIMLFGGGGVTMQ